MKLSVIIVNYNVKYFLEQALHAVRKAAANVSCEVFVVDNNSVDGSVEMVARKFPEVKLIANKKNLGFSAANNQAILKSTGEYILLLNPDTVVEEDTFEKVCKFMDEHADAGGLGVKMLDGSGKFLPESKRGLPSPVVAFYKIFGLSSLFPKSRTFGRYHLGFLDKDKVHEIDVLSGAFMLMRKSVLDKVGLLDEDYFMYGEDIDLSYRIQKGGFKNYYFPETRIIHYKGESTKKSSVNYVFVFYRAMVIFARKHFSSRHAALFGMLINLAIWFRAGIAITSRFIKSIALPALDAVILLGGMYLLKNYWEHNIKHIVGLIYPPEFMRIAVPSYIVLWLGSVFFSGGYDKPWNISKLVRGLLTGTVFILVVYALLPEELRFSRALILLGAAWAAVSMVGLRMLLHTIKPNVFPLSGQGKQNLVIVGKAEESQRVLSLLKLADTTARFIGYVSPPDTKSIDGDAFVDYHLGNWDQLDEIVRMYRADEVIFCGADIPSNLIIEKMSLLGDTNIEFKIAPPESLFIIGSSSVDNPGDLYVVDINAITRPENRRNKRLLDLGVGLILLMISPLLIWMQRHPGGFLSNIYKVLTGKYSWVGFYPDKEEKISKVKPGILNPFDAVGHSKPDSRSALRMNALYAKDYKLNSDITILIKGFRLLGRRA